MHKGYPNIDTELAKPNKIAFDKWAAFLQRTQSSAKFMLGSFMLPITYENRCNHHCPHASMCHCYTGRDIKQYTP